MVATVWSDNPHADFDHPSLVIPMRLPVLRQQITLLLMIAFAAVASSVLRAGTVTILPMSPKAGEAVTVEYTPQERDADLIAQGSLHAVVYLFTREAENPEAIEIQLKKSSGRWGGSLQLRQDVVYGIIKVGNGHTYDRNGELFWDFLVTSDGTRHVEGANLKAAMARFGQLPAPCRMKEDLREALDYLNMESRLYPKSSVAQLNYIMVARTVEELNDEEALGKYRELSSSTMQISTPMDAIAISQAYAAQGKPEEAQRIMEDASRRFPKSIAAEQYALEQIGQAQSLEDFIARAVEHLKAYPTSSARQNITDAVVRAATQQGALRELITFLDGNDQASALTYHQAVNFIGSNDTLRQEALRLIEDGFKAAEDPRRRPKNIGMSEWQHEQRIATSLLYFVKGAIERVQSRNSEAIASLEKSVEIAGADVEKNCLDMLVELYKQSGKTKNALKVAETAISNGRSTQAIVDTYRSLQRSNGLDSVEIETAEARLRQSGRSAMARRVQQEFLNLPMIDGTFQKLDGTPVNISDWKGKVVIIDYWATWCGPCRQSFPSLQKLYERYRHDPNVIIAVVNVWEKSEDRVKTVKDFMAKNSNLTFPMFLDKDDSVVRKFGVTGIPTKFYLGKDGRIQFKEVGLHPEEQFLEEATTRIEALLAQ
jgi:thiol-disulfide isomerase/thioredoxin